jgi:hypothetical protein
MKADEAPDDAEGDTEMHKAPLGATEWGFVHCYEIAC